MRENIEKSHTQIILTYHIACQERAEWGNFTALLSREKELILFPFSRQTFHIPFPRRGPFPRSDTGNSVSRSVHYRACDTRTATPTSATDPSTRGMVLYHHHIERISLSLYKTNALHNSVLNNPSIRTRYRVITNASIAHSPTSYDAIHSTQYSSCIIGYFCTLHECTCRHQGLDALDT